LSEHASARANSVEELKARAAGERIGGALAAYHTARTAVARDTTPLDLCATVYRSLAVPLATTGTARIAEVVGAARQEPCDPQQSPPAGAPRVIVDSVTYTLARVTVYARVRRGENLYTEVAALELPPGRSWVIKEIRISQLLRAR